MSDRLEPSIRFLMIILAITPMMKNGARYMNAPASAFIGCFPDRGIA